MPPLPATSGFELPAAVLGAFSRGIWGLPSHSMVMSWTSQNRALAASSGPKRYA